MGSKEMLFFPGCSLDGTGREYGLSTMAVLDALDMGVEVLEDWNCCGAIAARKLDSELSVRLSVRNLELAAAKECDLMVTCAACYNNLEYSLQHLKEHPETSAQTAPIENRPESVNVHHILNLLTRQEVLDRLKGKITRPLADMKLACYYGCLLVRPGGYTQVDDPENPVLMDDLMRLCGAQTIDWSYKTDCCGASASLTKKSLAMQLMANIFAAAIAQDATALVTACPLCQMNLDAWQKDVGKVLGRRISIPVFYFTELLAMAMDLQGVPKWMKGHLTNTAGVLEERR